MISHGIMSTYVACSNTIVSTKLSSCKTCYLYLLRSGITTIILYLYYSFGLPTKTSIASHPFNELSFLNSFYSEAQSCFYTNSSSGEVDIGIGFSILVENDVDNKPNKQHRLVE